MSEKTDIAGALRFGVISVALSAAVLELRYHYAKRQLKHAAEQEASAAATARVILGSGSEVKRRAVERSLENDILDGASVVCSSVASGVNEQPVGHEETLKGARNRAQAAARIANEGASSGLKS